MLLAAALAFHAGSSRASGATPALTYVALGDSIALWNYGQSYPAVYGARTATDLGSGVSLQNMAIGGWTSSDLLGALRTHEAYRTVLPTADVVTWNIGVNDFQVARDAYKTRTCGGADNQDCLRGAITTFEANYDAIMAEVRALNPDPLLVIRAVDVYYPFVAVDGADGSFPALRPYVDAINSYIRAASAAAGIPTASVHAAFNGIGGAGDPAALGYLAPDGLHPSVAGSAAIAEAMRVVAYEPLAHDSDADLVVDGVDNCPAIPNPGQENADGDFTDLSAYGKPYNDRTWPNSDKIGDVCDSDIDGDGLANAVEAGLGPGGPHHAQCGSATAATDPVKLDTDADGFMDRGECLFGTDPSAAASKPPSFNVPGDTDRDGLPDTLEAVLGTNPALPDSDGDRLLDGVEVLRYGSDPLNANTDGDKCGDGKEAASLNDDTTVNSIDQVILARAIVSVYLRPFDVNRDGAVNSTDLLIQMKAYGSC
ncbi:MAG: thrombospondin type 3 repeat-containing protein [Chloroflexi bacterium]|nr:thrombospondin type 3 repeat-containing protein [Chloroflexota bacterium]